MPGNEPLDAVSVKVLPPNKTWPAPFVPEIVLMEAPLEETVEISNAPLTMTPVDSARIPPSANTRVWPALIVVVPVKLLALDKVTVPTPVMVKSPLPERITAMVAELLV